MTETTIENYQERAFRTMSKLGSKAQDGAHMSMGIVTELEELKDAIKNKDLINIGEEIGDCFWYVANECTLYGMDFKSMMSWVLTNPKIESNFKLHNLVDIHKRELAYKKKIGARLKNDLYFCIVGLMHFLNNIAIKNRLTVEGCLVKNIAKLYKRYPNKFTQENALNRDLDAEHEILKD